MIRQRDLDELIVKIAHGALGHNNASLVALHGKSNSGYHKTVFIESWFDLYTTLHFFIEAKKSDKNNELTLTVDNDRQLSPADCYYLMRCKREFLDAILREMPSCQ